MQFVQFIADTNMQPNTETQLACSDGAKFQMPLVYLLRLRITYASMQLQNNSIYYCHYSKQ
jgi:hypothetical protein